jgi:hypothetical protein
VADNWDACGIIVDVQLQYFVLVPFLFILFALHFHDALLGFDTIKRNGRFSLDLYIGEFKSLVHLSKKYAALF